MNLLETLAASPLIHRFGYALVHFLWQGLAIAVILSAALQLLRGGSPRVRYLAAWVALLGMAASVPITARLVAPPTSPELASIADEPSTMQRTIAAAETGAGVTGPDRVDRRWNDEMAEMPLARMAVESPAVVPGELHNDAPPSAGNTLGVRISQSMRPALPWVVYGWLVGVFVLSLWRLGGWIHLRRLRRFGTSPAPEATQQMLGHLLGRLRVSHSVQLLESTLVKVPTVIGWLRPAILLPVGILAEMPPQQLEMILAHELAHVRRYDFLLNLLQTAVETLLFYHPAVWWVSRRIRIEREACCDDLAAAAVGDRLLYARALTKLEELRHEAPSSARAGLGVAADGGSLRSRIRRLMRLSDDDHNWPRARLGSSIAVLLLIGALVGYAATAGEPSLTPAENGAAESATQPTDKGRGVAWGEPVEGVQSRLQRGVFRNGEQWLSFDLHNDSRELSVQLAPGGVPREILVDNVAYRWEGRIAGALPVCKPGQHVTGGEFRLGKNWTPIKTVSGPKTLELKPGKHTVQAIVYAAAKDVEHTGRKSRVTSNAVEIAIISADADSATQSVTRWGKAVSGLQAGIRYRGKSPRVRVGETAPLSCLVRNVSSNPIRFTTTEPSPWGHSIRDAAGQPVGVCGMKEATYCTCPKTACAIRSKWTVSGTNGSTLALPRRTPTNRLSRGELFCWTSNPAAPTETNE